MKFTFNGVDFLDRLEYLEAREDFRVKQEEQERQALQLKDRQRIINTRRIQKETIENQEAHRIKMNRISSECLSGLVLILITICITMVIVFKVYNVDNPCMLSYFIDKTVTLLNNLILSIIIIAFVPIIVLVVINIIYCDDMSEYKWITEAFNDNWSKYDEDGFIIKEKNED